MTCLTASGCVTLHLYFHSQYCSIYSSLGQNGNSLCLRTQDIIHTPQGQTFFLCVLTSLKETLGGGSIFSVLWPLEIKVHLIYWMQTWNTSHRNSYQVKCVILKIM